MRQQAGHALAGRTCVGRQDMGAALKWLPIFTMRASKMHCARHWKACNTDAIEYGVTSYLM